MPSRSLRAALATAVVAAVVALAAPTAASAATDDAPDWAGSDEIAAFVAAQQQELRLPALVVVVIADGEVLYEGAVGEAAPGGPAVGLDTTFSLGSTSKQFTGLAVQQLIADGDLSLDDTVGEVIPELVPQGSSPYDDVTIEQLLSHRSGLSYASGLREWELWSTNPSISEHTRMLLSTAPTSEPGERYEYTNANYTLLGAIVEKTTGRSFADAMNGLVLEPLGLSATTGDVAQAQADGLAAWHYPWYEVANLVTPQPAIPAAVPSAFMSSSATDLARLLEAHLGVIETNFPAETLAAAREPIAEEYDYSEYASGWSIRPYWELRDLDEQWDDGTLPMLWEHSGSTLRSFSHLAMQPEMGLGVVILANTGMGMDQSTSNTLAYELLHLVSGTAAQPFQVDPLIAIAPVLITAVPLLLAGAIVWLALTLRHAPRSRAGRWAPIVAGAIVIAAALVLTLFVVPAQTGGGLFETWWWASVPDLAISTGLMLLLSAVAIGLLIAVLVRRPRRAKPATA